MAKIYEHHACDAQDQAAALTGWQQRYEQLSCGRFEGRAWQMVMDQGALLRESSNLHLRQQITPPPDHLVLAIPLAVQPGSRFAGRPLARESLLVFGADNEHHLVSAGALDLIGLSVHRDNLKQLPSQKLEWLHQAERVRNLDLSADAASAIRHMLLAVTANAASGMEILDSHAQESELLNATLSQTVMLAMHSAQQASSIPRRADSRLKVVQRAIDFMQAHVHDAIGVPDICAAAYASRRSLQYCFEEVLHTTPQAYLRALRLNEARRVLKQDVAPAILDIACDLGFSSASHFTRHYKIMFGELPSQTLKASPAGAPPIWV
ncbi:AraC family transcriptional regulator [Limnohabitans sp. T6-5]|uniref:helix-turn-helix domain-containing protein n=1 Tax=Limnohabitans sp. T6-5 TaxID=1100724 RepID=UPI000D382CA5|nr:helix-turn-helix domain-containing protein [Limnohabitans sp. T6-5]PUE05996.1 AraC family transcriptional regulator [Limnohabitans sp. T6-5]